MNAAATIPMPTPTVAGTGTYYIKATTLAGCTDIKPVTVTINPLPTAFLGVGSGSYCAGGSGMVVGLNGSQVGVNYTLWSGLTPVSVTIPGTGYPISFGLQTLAGYYWVIAENVTTHCVTAMFDCVYITIDPQVPAEIEIEPSANPVMAGVPVTFTATPNNEGPNPVYQWMVNGFNVGANQATFTYVPVNYDVVTCLLVSNLPCVSNNPALSNAVVMNVTGVPVSSVVAGGVASAETKCYNATQTLTFAGSGTTFTVNAGGSATMIAGQNILYLPGTTVVPGGYMHGYISNNYCGQKTTTLVATSAEVTETVAAPVQKFGFKLYPNPTSGRFILEQTSGETMENVKVEVYGMRGDKLMTGDLDGTRKREFMLSDLPQGLYFVKVIANGHVETFKVVKTK